MTAAREAALATMASAIGALVLCMETAAPDVVTNTVLGITAAPMLAYCIPSFPGLNKGKRPSQENEDSSKQENDTS